MSKTPHSDMLVPTEEIDHRRLRLQALLAENGVDAVFILQRVDLFYFTGTAQNGFLFIPAEGDPLLFIRRYFKRARAESPLVNLVETKSIGDIPHLLREFYPQPIGCLGFELDVMPVNDFHFFRKLLQPQKTMDASPWILAIRSIKSKWEIEQMKKTATMSAAAFDFMSSSIRPGISEMEFAGHAETYARSIGHGAKLRVRNYQTEGYPWHVLSGESGGMVGLLDAPASGRGTSAAFPCGAGSKLLEKNEPIMVDFGSVMNGYHLDETRMFAMNSMPQKAAQASLAAIEIQQALMEAARPGEVCGNLFETAVSLAREAGLENAFLGPPGYKVHFVGHGVGTELVEPPFIARNKRDRLQVGMTLALEPKFVFEGEFAAGIESVIQVTEKGGRLISKVPVEVFVR
jgi:Xaa-Pro aminopeptidase